MNAKLQRVRIRPRYRCRRWVRYGAGVVFVVAGVLAPQSYAEERPVQTGDASAPASASLQFKRLDEKMLGAIRGEGGAGVPQSLINLSIILWDEPGHGGSKSQALVGNSPGDSARTVIFNGSRGVSININR